MRYYSKIRKLVKRANELQAEARKLARGSRGRVDRMAEAEGYRVKALWLAGRIDDEAFTAYQCEQLDAKQTAV
jgi:hypothetical protein